MTAEPATAEYGRLSVMLQSQFEVARLFTVPAGAFRPPPKVESAVARLVPLRDRAPRIPDRALFEKLVTAAFSQRRKTLRNALAAHAGADALRDAGIDPSARGETLDVDAFVRLANRIAETRAH
jgi:16S rRNA (adenine1518-N6/adenine1519-N6)-dimethyltransferase